MQSQRLATIHNLLALRSLAVQVPKYTQIQQQVKLYEFCLKRNLTQAAKTTKTDDQKTKQQQQKITLIAQNQAMSITTLEEAQKLAKRRDLHLLRLNQTDAKTGRLMFKLVTAADMLADDSDSKKSQAEKGSKKTTEKSLTIGARITDHDLGSRLKNISKWLLKRHEVRILIQGNVSGADEGNAERIVKAIESTIKEPQIIGKIVQRRQKGGFIKFSIMPVATEATPNPAPAPPAQS